MYGRGEQLATLKQRYNDPTVPRFARKRAHMAYWRIVRQLKDRRLMGLRSQLIRASLAQDGAQVDKITRRIRAYEKQERESGL